MEKEEFSSTISDVETIEYEPVADQAKLSFWHDRYELLERHINASWESNDSSQYATGIQSAKSEMEVLDQQMADLKFAIATTALNEIFKAGKWRQLSTPPSAEEASSPETKWIGENTNFTVGIRIQEDLAPVNPNTSATPHSTRISIELLSQHNKEQIRDVRPAYRYKILFSADQSTPDTVAIQKNFLGRVGDQTISPEQTIIAMDVLKNLVNMLRLNGFKPETFIAK